MAFCYLTFCISLLQDCNAINGTLDVEQKLNRTCDDFYWYANQKYNVTKDVTDVTDILNICGDPSYYDDLFGFPKEVTKGFLTNNVEEIEKSKVALIAQIALDSNYTLTTQELEICLDVSLLF